MPIARTDNAHQDDYISDEVKDEEQYHGDEHKRRIALPGRDIGEQSECPYDKKARADERLPVRSVHAFYYPNGTDDRDGD